MCNVAPYLPGWNPACKKEEVGALVSGGKKCGEIIESVLNILFCLSMYLWSISAPYLPMTSSRQVSYHLIVLRYHACLLLIASIEYFNISHFVFAI